jgi:hypothetical protein
MAPASRVLHVVLAAIVGVIGSIGRMITIGDVLGTVLAFAIGATCAYLAARFGDPAWRWFLERL